MYTYIDSVVIKAMKLTKCRLLSALYIYIHEVENYFIFKGEQ